MLLSVDSFIIAFLNLLKDSCLGSIAVLVCPTILLIMSITFCSNPANLVPSSCLPRLVSSWSFTVIGFTALGDKPSLLITLPTFSKGAL